MKKTTFERFIEELGLEEEFINSGMTEVEFMKSLGFTSKKKQLTKQEEIKEK